MPIVRHMRCPSFSAQHAVLVQHGTVIPHRVQNRFSLNNRFFRLFRLCGLQGGVP